tara:strand:+ start:5834 stop:6721 length:888 start_codon:yes stop_codon:yes gene_type:complete
MIRKLSFFIAEAFIGMKRSSLMITVSLATVFISLLIFGFFLILNLNLVEFTSFLNSKLEIRVFLKDDLTKKEVRSFKAQLLQLESVKSVDILDKKQEWYRFKQQYSQLQLDELVQENPLPLSMTVQLINQKDLLTTVNLLQGFTNFVDDVIYGGQMAERMQRVSSFILYFGWGVVIVLFCATFLIIFNTIKLTIMNRSNEISIMKLVGATDNFVMGPFLVEGALLGLASSVFAIGMIHVGLKLLSYKMISFMPFFPHLISEKNVFLIYLIVILWGSIMCLMGAFLSTRSTLKKIL